MPKSNFFKTLIVGNFAFRSKRSKGPTWNIPQDSISGTQGRQVSCTHADHQIKGARFGFLTDSRCFIENSTLAPLISTSSPFSFNRYSYANNNPYAYTDPSGMLTEDAQPLKQEVMLGSRIPGDGSSSPTKTSPGPAYGQSFGRASAAMDAGGASGGNSGGSGGTSASASSQINGVTAPKAQKQFSIGVGGLIGGNPIFVLPGPFIGGGAAVGFTSDGQLFVQFQALGAAGPGAYAGVDIQGGASISSSPLPSGFSVQRSIEADTNLGFGGSIGGSVQYDGNGGGLQTGVGHLGVGFGVQSSIGVVQTVTIATPQLFGN